MLKFLEHACCQASADYSMHQDCAIHLANIGGLENNIESFLKLPANDESLKSYGNYRVISIALCAIIK